MKEYPSCYKTYPIDTHREIVERGCMDCSVADHCFRHTASKNPAPPTASILEEAQTIIWGDREQTYGAPSKNLEKIAQQWSLYLEQLYDVKIPICAEDVCWMMADLKKVRQMNVSKRDNLVDAAGYIGLIERL